MRWYRLAAEQGYALAQFNLGVKYANGEGVPEDDVTAYAWLNIAAAQGKSSANEGKEHVAKIYDAVSGRESTKALQGVLDALRHPFPIVPRTPALRPAVLGASSSRPLISLRGSKSVARLALDSASKSTYCGTTTAREAWKTVGSEWGSHFFRVKKTSSLRAAASPSP